MIDLREFIRVSLNDERMIQISQTYTTVEEIIDYIWEHFNIAVEEGDQWWTASDMLDIITQYPNNNFDCEDCQIFFQTWATLRNMSISSLIYYIPENHENHAINLLYDTDGQITPIDVTLGKTRLGSVRGNPNEQPIVEYSANFINVFNEWAYNNLL